MKQEEQEQTSVQQQNSEDRNTKKDTVESAESAKHSSLNSGESQLNSIRIDGMVDKLSSMLKEEEDGKASTHRETLSKDLIDQCDRERQKSFKKLRKIESTAATEMQQQKEEESIFDLIQGFDSRREMINPPYTVKADHLAEEGQILGGSSSDNNSQEEDAIKEEVDHISDAMRMQRPRNQNFEFQGMFDDWDQLEIDMYNQDYQKFISDSLTIQAIKDTAKKLENLRKEFYQDENKLKTVRQATGRIKDKVMDQTGKIINKNIDKIDKHKQRFQRKKKELLNQLKRRVSLARSYSQTETFMRTLDKLSFILGVMLFGSFAYIMGSMPNYGFYIFYSILVPTMWSIRFVNYKQKGWHYFMIDFCYFGSSTVFMFVNIFPKSEIWYRLAFLYANGALAVATAAFSNALIFHQFDRLICLSTHPVPLVVMWNVKHVTMKQQKELPAEEQRFLKLPEHDTWSDMFWMNIVLPYAWYFVWAFLYYMVNFQLKEKKIKEQQYSTLYGYFQKIKWSGKILKKAGPTFAPFVFMAYHCGFFTVSHCIALMAYYSKWIHTFVMFLWLFICVWNGSAYYVKFFQYTQKLSTQQMLQKQQLSSHHNSTAENSSEDIGGKSKPPQQHRPPAVQQQPQQPEQQAQVLEKPSAAETCVEAVGGEMESKKEQ